MLIEISKVQNNLYDLISHVNKGEIVTITDKNKPVADLVKHEAHKSRRLGILRGKLSVPQNFHDESEEINTMFYGKAK